MDHIYTQLSGTFTKLMKTKTLLVSQKLFCLTQITKSEIHVVYMYVHVHTFCTYIEFHVHIP